MANEVWDWLSPEVSTNLVLNPVFSTMASGLATINGTLTQDTTPANILFDAQSGHYSGASLPANSGVYFNIQTAASATTYVSAWIKGSAPAKLGVYVGGAWTYKTSLTTLETQGSWTRYGASFTAGEAGGATYAGIFWSGTIDAYIGGFQCEQSSTYTTQIWGDAGPGYVWNGADGQSSSTRYILDPDGKVVYGGSITAIDDRVNVVCETMVGVGLLPYSIESQSLAGETPALFVKHDLKPRDIQLSLAFNATSLAGSHTRRAALLALWPYGREGWLRYNGANATLQIKAAVSGQFDLDLSRSRLGQRTVIQFTALDPKFSLVYAETTALTLSSSPSSSYARMRTDSGGWAAMSSGLFAQPRRAITGPDGTIYVGTLASGGSAKLQKWTGSAWADVGGAFTGSITAGPVIYDLVPNADWTVLYVIGDYTTVGGTAGFGGVAAITLSSGAAAKLGTGAAGGAPLCGAYVQSTSRLYVGGLFATNMGGVANTSYFCYWDGANWQSVGTTRPTAGVYTVIADPQGNLYLGGNFTNAFALGNVSAPTNTLVSGGSLPSGFTFKAYVRAGDGTGTPDYQANNGHTTGALAGASVTTTSTQAAVLVSWTAVPGAQYYLVYLDSASYGPPTTLYFAVVPWTQTSYLVTGGGNGLADRTLFANMTGSFGSRVVKWRAADGGWERIAQTGGGFDGIVYSLAFAGHSGTLIAGGAFANADNNAAGRVAWTRGKRWLPLGDTAMPSGNVYRVKYNNGTVWAVGSFPSADGDTAAALVARLDGFPTGRWTHTDVALTNSSNNVYDLITQPYGLMLFDDTSFSSASGATSVAYTGTANLYPRIVVTGPGTLRYIGTATARLVMSYTLQAGEVVTIDCDKRRVTSNINGDITYKVHPSSNFDAFYLAASASQTVYVHMTGTTGASSVNMVGNRQLITGDV